MLFVSKMLTRLSCAALLSFANNNGSLGIKSSSTFLYFSFGGFFCIPCNSVSTWTELFISKLKPHILRSSPLCQTSNESHDKDWHNGNKWAFSGIQTHSPVCGRKEDKAFYSIYRRKTWPLGPSGQKVRVLGAESRFQQSAGRPDICPPCHIPSHLRSLKHSPALCL